MIGSRIPRFFLYATVLGTVVAAIMLSMFFGQYRWLAGQIMSTSYEEHRTLLEASFNRHTRAELRAISDALPADLVAADENSIVVALNRALIANPKLKGLQVELSTGATFTIGAYPQVDGDPDTVWLTDYMLQSSPIVRNELEIGRIAGSFALDWFHADLTSFTEVINTKEGENRRASYVWIGGGTIAVLLLCGSVVWLLVRGQTKRIRRLKAQAEKFRDADFGEPILESRGDELGALAAVFNDMRDKLRTTTHSRDYVDSILSGMNEAIIVTTEGGQIERINIATTHLLGYEEDELKGTSIDFVINSKKSRSLAGDAPSGLPREAIFESKFGESIPVSYTCSVIQGDDGNTCRIYAAQNITERRRSEKRIRYLRAWMP